MKMFNLKMRNWTVALAIKGEKKLIHWTNMTMTITTIIMDSEATMVPAKMPTSINNHDNDLGVQ